MFSLVERKPQNLRKYSKITHEGGNIGKHDKIQALATNRESMQLTHVSNPAE